MFVIQALLAIAAIYSGGMWLYMAFASYRGRAALKTDESLRHEVQAHTFHLGLCCIVAAGFLGLMVK